MSTILHLDRLRPSTTRLVVPCLLLALGGLLASPPQLQSAELFQSDDFNDGNDTGWNRYDPIGSHPAFPDQATWTFPNGGYRMQTAVSPMPEAVGPGRAGSLRPEIYTDFYVAVDIVNWDDSLDQAIGLMARLTDVGLGSTDGYAMTYQVQDHDIDITWFKNEDTSTAGGGGSVPLTGEDSVTLIPGHSYRFAFSGKGSSLSARVYELPDTVNPIMEASGVDTTYASGQCGLIVFDNSSGTMVTDATFDNYYATDIEPPRIKMTAQAFFEYELSWPADTSAYETSAYVLQSSTVLPGTALDWTNVGSSLVTLSEGRFLYTMETDPTAGGLPQRYFRLFRPAPGAN